MLKVPTKEREARNRRVEIFFTARRFKWRDVTFPPPAQTLTGPGALAVPPSIPPSLLPAPGPAVPPLSQSIPPYKAPSYREQLEQAVHGDPVLSGLRKLSKPAYDAVIDGLAKADELAVEKALDYLPADANVKAALNAAAVALLKTWKGERWQPPTPPRYELPPSAMPEMPKAPGETIFQGPTLKWDFPFKKKRE
jgi:hypothetical protein